ncbi:MAG: entericidin A/B family lipoprotein [Xanthomonadales bacterium]|nr:entericidin A/B family lipoprotein [Xanthomonadales bacterium]
MKNSAKALLAVACAAVLLATVGCNTVRGVGKDMETAGKAIQRKSDKAKD